MNHSATKKLYKKSLFIFRRDLRIEDNNGLNAALAQSNVVIPCFIADPRQVEQQNNYRSTNAITFMIESLQDLDNCLAAQGARLSLLYGIPHEIVHTLIRSEQIEAIFVNKDYTPFSTLRDAQISKVAEQEGISFISCNDLLLTRPEDIATKTGSYYSIFSAFYKRATQEPVALPEPWQKGSFCTKPLNQSMDLKALQEKLAIIDNTLLAVHGGTTRAYTLLDQVKDLKTYANTRDIASIQTSLLSAYLKFGCISIRTVYHSIKDTLGATHPLLRQLYWRDFFTHIAYHAPHVFGHAFHQQYDALPWSTNTDHLQAWRSGNTGFPIVDAGMRQLNATGFMHNRVRMIVASFLVKDLHIDWRVGERYFAQQLVDYDPSVNNGNWQWCASTGCDSQPYFRIFNPWLQQKKFDADCVYIKRWIPELQKLDTRVIHAWHTAYSAHTIQYPRPIVDHPTQAALSKKLFRSYGHKKERIP